MQIVWQGKRWGTTPVWFPAMVSTLTSLMILLNERQPKVSILNILMLRTFVWISELRLLSNGIPHCGNYGFQEDLYQLHQMVALSIEKREAGHEALKEQYKRYKDNYVKHLRFNPESLNLSKIILTSSKSTNFFQHLSLSMLLWRRWISFLTRLPLMRLSEMSRFHFVESVSSSR